jgi:hypothetical protein
MVLESTQPVAETITRNFPGYKRAAGADILVVSEPIFKRIPPFAGWLYFVDVMRT